MWKSLEYLARVRQLRAQAPVGKETLQAALVLDCCNRCFEKDFTQRQGAAGTKRVVCVGGAGGAELDVPMYDCAACRRAFHAHPLSIGAFPSTPVHALDLSTFSNETPIWIDTLSLVQIQQLQFKSASTPEEAICDAFSTVLDEASSGKLSITRERLQAHLGPVIEEFMVVQNELDDMAFLGAPRYPINKEQLLSCCGACWRAGQPGTAADGPFRLHSLSMDGCMKIKHFKFAPAGSQPAIQQRILTTNDRSDKLPPLFTKAPTVVGSESFCATVKVDMGGVNADSLVCTALPNSMLARCCAAQPAVARRKLLSALIG